MAKESKINKVKKEGKEKKNGNFWKDSRAELKKVTWPTAKQLFSKTAVVIAIVLIIALIVSVLDTVFEKGYEFIMNKATSSTSQTVTENANEVEVTEVDATGDGSIDLTSAEDVSEDTAETTETMEVE